MRPLTCLFEQELGATANNLLAEVSEGADQVLEVELLRLAANKRHHVAAERRLQRREAVELVQHHVGHSLALELDHHAIAVAVGLVAQLGDAVDLLLANELGHALDHRGLVHLIRDLADDDRLALLAQRLDLDLAAHDDRAAAGVIGAGDAGPAEDDAAGRKIPAWYDPYQVVDGERRIV